jgi:putative intracellular protease/amidase
MADTTTIGFVFIPGVADWEYGLLSASAVEWFGARAVVVTPDGKPVRSASGFGLAADRAAEPAENGDLDALAVIGSDGWAAEGAPDVSGLLKAVEERGGVVGGICGATLALARAGLFKGRTHTSNGRDWILRHMPDYAGRENYHDVPHAVADGRIVSAPGSAPGTFALTFLKALYPDKTAELAEMRSMFSKEYADAS